MVATAAGLLTAPVASASIGVASLGTDAPPLIVPAGDAAGLPVTFAPLDTRPQFADYTDVTFSATASLTFNNPLNHRRVGESWGTWSHGYLGDVYRNYSSEGQPIIMTLLSTVGFDYFSFYAEPGPFTELDITALGLDSTGATVSLLQPVHGQAGAKGWGFYSTGGSTLTSITVTIEAQGFAVGEFSYHERVPAPGALSVMGLAAATLTRRRRAV